MRKILIAMALMPVLALADTEKVGDVTWFYTVVDEGVVVTGVDANLEVLEIPAELGGRPVTTVREFSFFGSVMKEIKIPSSVTDIQHGAFMRCERLAEIWVDVKNPKYCGVDGILYDKGGKTLVAFPGGRGGNVTISDGVTCVASEAFAYNSTLKSVTIPTSVGIIGDAAFRNCEQLSSVVLSHGVKAIGGGAFMMCGNLSTINIPTSVESIGAQSFEGCEALGSGVIIIDGCVLAVNGSCPDQVNLPEGIRMIAGGAFSQCTAKCVTLPSSVSFIGDDAFFYCQRLESVAISEGVTHIGNRAFATSGSLVEIKLAVNNPSYAMLDGVLYDKRMKTLVCCPNGRRRAIVIPSGVEKIGDWAFADCAQIGSIEIPSSVLEIGTDAFFGCVGLTSVTIPPNLMSIGDAAFVNCRGLTSMTIPSGVRSIGRHTFMGCDGLGEVEFEGEPLGNLDELEIPQSAFIWYNARFADEWQSVLTKLGLNGAPYKPIRGSSVSPSSESDKATVNVTITNVVVQYVLNSVQPQFAFPASSDVGFVNIIAEVKGGCVAVPATWTVNYPKFTEKFGSDFTKALAMKTGKKDGAGNPMFVWQDYVAGTDPTDETDVFTASITIVDGEVKVSYSPELDDARKALRKYTTWGKAKLTDKDWSVVGEGEEGNFNFFKVTVEMK